VKATDNIKDLIGTKAGAALLVNSKAHATLLTTLYSEAAMIGKDDGNRETADSEVLKVVKKFVKNNNEFIGAMLADSDGKLSSSQSNKEKALRDENHLLEIYLPTQMDADELSPIIISFISDNPDAKMGDVMQYLKREFDGQYDGKEASAIVREELS